VFHSKFLPLTEGFVYATANDVEDLRQKVSENKLCAIMFEVVQGEGGVMPLDAKFVNEIVSLAEKNDLLVICDEVQTGNGRTGELYGYMNYNIKPNVVTTAKGLGGGLPIGACLMDEKTQNVLAISDHGSTFGGNPVASAGAISILSRLDENTLNGVKEKSKMIFDTLSNADGVKGISGLGLMIGIDTVKDAGEVIAECIKNGLLVIKAKNKVRLLPPLNISEELLVKALEVIKKALV
jgi:acetylornithine/N-succinyldiaminopimelate aminotransferase